MPQENVPLIAFNRGLISQLALARVDLRRTALSADIQTNYVPRVLGSMMIRPGLGYTGETKDNAFGVGLQFTYPPNTCLLYTSPSPRDRTRSRMPSSA